MKIVCIGTHNTGKTTFIHDFLCEYPSFMTPVRTYRDLVREDNLAINQEGTCENQTRIFNYVKNQQQQLPASQDIIMDRCAFDAMVYTTAICGWQSITEAHTELLASMEKEAYLLLSQFDLILHFPLKGNEHIVITADGLRDTDEKYRKYVDYIFTDQLCSFMPQYSFDIKGFHRIVGSREARMAYMKRIMV